MSASRSLKQRLRALLLPARFMRDIDGMRMNQGRILSAFNRSRPAQPLQDCEFSVFSQWGEDGIIQRLVNEVPLAHKTFIEFGVEDFAESNCRFLMMHNNWRGFVVDGSERWIGSLRASSWWWKYDLRAHVALMTRDNINDVLLRSGFDRDLGVLSIDVDGMDYWLLDAITAFAPRILIVEYNALFGADREIVVPYNPAFSRHAAHFSGLYYGASLAALARLAEHKGYALVGTESAGINAFFVRNDVLGSLKALTAPQAFSASMVRQGRDERGRLDYRDRDAQYDLIRGMPVVNVVSGATEPL